METTKKIYPFNFDRPIDNGYMQSMYGNNYLQLEEIFAVTITCLDDDLDMAKKKFTVSDREGVRRVFHKIKATFGFIGMMEMQEDCRQMEIKCSSVDSLSEINNKIEALLDKINNHRNIVEKEYKKLMLFNLEQS